MSVKACVLHAKHDLRIDAIEPPQVSDDTVVLGMSHGGICGSDLHYFHDGGVGTIRVTEPIIVGHEVSGTVLAVGRNVSTLVAGDRVAVCPSQPCHSCEFCNLEQFQHCKNMRFLGSARTVPHVQGGMRNQMLATVDQCFKVDPDTSLSSAACAEPLAVCLHAASQVGSLKGKKVLVTGAGPIGALCCAVTALQGAAAIIVTDLFDFTLSKALEMGATQSINIASSPDALADYAGENGGFDVVFECSAAEPAIRSAIDVVRPRGWIVQVGVAGNLSLPVNAIVGKEIRFVGTHRFHPEFAEAVALINSGKIDVSPMVTQVYPMEDALEAFKMASNREAAIKVQLDLRGA
ncbi:L-idonate 5-dehydrogenase [Pacificibacter maritimus]|uniref:L-idonate 5-dehydrogenase n=1 Tax=Pacificibacter maritimus TaxID=762213 RepID=A0A3N4UYC6_9RHOB|nr:L-idonate 5-dehydrogenase [Pacificibacter maritimus]RPE66570.1 L-idonate 5-dehydrogenase [Pacificibacter maritimus]